MKKSDHILFENTPAESAREAYPIGNGRLGCMVFGNLPDMRLSLTYDDFADGEINVEREWNGEYVEVSALREFVKNNVYTAPKSFADLCLSFPEGEISNYKRYLDINNSVVGVDFMLGENKVSVEMFASNPKKCLAVSVKSLEPISLSFTFKPRDEYTHYSYGAQTDYLSSRGTRKYSASVRTSSDVAVILDGAKSSVIDSRESVFYFTIESRADEREASALASKYMNSAASISYDALVAEHIIDVRSIYDRVKLSLQSPDVFDLSTSRRLKAFSFGAKDYSLCVLMFNMGRYLYTASCREDSNKKNLFGIFDFEEDRCAELYPEPSEKTPESSMEFIRKSMLLTDDDTYGIFPNMMSRRGLVGNVCFSAFLYEMLIGEENGRPKALPYLPSEFLTGSVEGLKIGDGRFVDISFCDGRLVDFKIYLK